LLLFLAGLAILSSTAQATEKNNNSESSQIAWCVRLAVEGLVVPVI
jgi:hypothetical protein